MTLSAAAKIELIETALADGKYRTLQKQLRYLRNTQQITIQGYLSDTHESLKAEAKRIIESLKPIAKTQDAVNAHITSSPYGDAIDSAYYEGNRKDA